MPLRDATMHPVTGEMTLEQINEELMHNLDALRAATHATANEFRPTTTRLEEILYSIIATHPAEANALVLKTTLSIPSPEGKRKPLPENGQMDNLTNYVGKVTEQPAVDGQEFDFVLHLPYAFTVGTHGSYDREAQVNSYPCIGFTTQYQPEWQVPVYARIGIAFGMFTSEDVLLTLPEIRSLRAAWVADDTFDPLFPRRKAQPSGSALMHYLKMRGYERYPLVDNAQKIPSLIRDEKFMAFLKVMEEKMMVPGLDTGLWNYEQVDSNYFWHGLIAIRGNPDQLVPIGNMSGRFKGTGGYKVQGDHGFDPARAAAEALFYLERTVSEWQFINGIPSKNGKPANFNEYWEFQQPYQGREAIAVLKDTAPLKRSFAK